MKLRVEDVSSRSPAVLMGRALSHPLRIRILTRMNAPIKQMSASDFSDESGVPLGNVSYHFRELVKCGCLEKVATHPRRGAVENVYEPVRKALAWAREWEDLGPATRQTLAASALRAAVEAIGKAIDSGEFEALPEPALCWDTMRTDPEGWAKVARIMARATEELLTIEAESRQRRDDDPSLPDLRVSYLLSTFGSPIED